MPEGLLIESLRRMEKMIWWLRFVFIAVVTAMTILFRPASFTAAIVVIMALLGLNLFLVTVLAWLGTARSARLLGMAALVTDAIAALAVFWLFHGDAAAMPIALFPFLAFQLAVRMGPVAAVAGLALFAAALAGRMLEQAFLLPGGMVRPPLVILWSAATIVLTALGHQLRAAEAARLSALREQRQLAERFRAVFAQALSHCGVTPEQTTYGDVIRAVEQMVSGKEGAAVELAARITEFLSDDARNCGLTRREREILALLAKGYSYNRIAAALFVTPSTVRNHIHNIKTKLELRSREEVIEFARRRKITL